MEQQHAPTLDSLRVSLIEHILEACPTVALQRSASTCRTCYNVVKAVEFNRIGNTELGRAILLRVKYDTSLKSLIIDHPGHVPRLHHHYSLLHKGIIFPYHYSSDDNESGWPEHLTSDEDIHVRQQLPFSGNQLSLGAGPDLLHEGWIWTKTGPRLPEGEAGGRAYILGYEENGGYEVCPDRP
jgi:hypothetical protein